MTSTTALDSPAGGVDRATALRFVIMLGVVSMFADATYESSRSITGPYLASLGARAAAVGVIAGLSALVDYGLRFISGYLTDRTRRYWTIASLGFGLNMAAVPLLALALDWQMAAVLILAERTGKAIRNPARDTMLSHATGSFGHGRGFGLQEALGQIGAVGGPLAVAGLLHFHFSYRFCLTTLFIPAVATLLVLSLAYRTYPNPADLEERPDETSSGAHLPPRFWLLLGIVALVAAGYVDYPLIAYHFRDGATVQAAWVPVFYAVAMGMDAVSALAFGHLFDRRGVAVLTAACALSALAAPLAFWDGFLPAMVGMALWGIGLGAQKAILKASIVTMVRPESRGTAYGLYNTVYGVAWFAGSSTMGWLYDQSHVALVGLSVTAELAAIPLILLVARGLEAREESTQGGVLPRALDPSSYHG